MQYTFATSMHCARCATTVSQILDDIETIDDYEIQLEHPQNLLLVEGSVQPQQIIDALADVGYEAKLL